MYVHVQGGDLCHDTPLLKAKGLSRPLAPSLCMYCVVHKGTYVLCIYG